MAVEISLASIGECMIHGNHVRPPALQILLKILPELPKMHSEHRPTGRLSNCWYCCCEGVRGGGAGLSRGEYRWGSAPLAPKNFLGGVAFFMSVVIFVYNVLIDLNEISESY